MSNLSDLLPAGAGGKQVNFVASGTIGNGVTVGLKTDGQVTEVSASSSTVGSETQVLAAYANASPRISVTTGSQAVAFVDNASSGDAYVLTGSGSSITKSASGYQYSSALVYSISSCYDSANNKVVVAWMNFSNPTRAQWIRVGTVSGTGASASISWGTAVNFANPTTYTGNNEMIYDPDTGNVCILYYNNTTYLTATCGTVSGTNITMGTPVVLASISVGSSNLVYDPSADRVIFIYEKDATTFNSRVGQMSGSGSTATVTLGAEQTILSANVGTVCPVYDPDNAKVCVAYIPNSTGALDVVVGTVNGAANSITWGTPATVQANVNNLAPTPNGMKATYDENIDRMVVIWRQNPSPNYSYMQGVTITGTTPSAGTNTVINSANSQLQDIEYNSTLQLSYCIRFNSAVSTIPSLLLAPVSTNSADFIGITDADVASGASGSVTIKGGIATIKGGTYAITVVNSGSGNKYAINGVEQAVLNLYEGATYKFDQSSGTNAGHPFRFSTTADGTHGGGSEYTTGVTTNGVPGNAGAYTQIVLASGAATLYYYCSVHSGMGGTANTLAIVPNSNYYVQADGTLTTTSSTVLAGRALSSTSINLDYTT